MREMNFKWILPKSVWFLDSSSCWCSFPSRFSS